LLTALTAPEFVVILPDMHLLMSTTPMHLTVVPNATPVANE